MLELLLAIAVAISTAITIIMLSLPSRYELQQSAQIATGKDPKPAADQRPDVSVQVLVLGDIGRSPRMQYHAMSIAKHGGRVYLIGYQESPLHPKLVNNRLVTVVALSPPPLLLRNSKLPFVVAGPLKVLFQIYTLVTTLAYTCPPSRFLLVQNPPSIPVLLISYVVSILRNTHLIIDWHNYGYTILSSKLPTTHPLVRISRVYEQALGRLAPTMNFTVTEAMKKQLQSKPWDIHSPIFTLHDRPAEIFQPVQDQQMRRSFLERLQETSDVADLIMEGQVKLLVSSTSWTPDEDFSLLLDALVRYSKEGEKRPEILAIITGKGPDKAKYLGKISTLKSDGMLENVDIKTAWLSMEDYAMLLSCADLGVCLHMSSSGVDLPMKVVDMFGAGLPVVGYAGYESWPELVREGVNGHGFETAAQLSEILVDLFAGGHGQLAALRRGAEQEGKRRWDDEWDDVAARVMGLIG